MQGEVGKDPGAQRCPKCDLLRMPRYKQEKSWAKHQEFCKGPLQAQLAKTSPQSKKQKTASTATGIDCEAPALEVPVAAPSAHDKSKLTSGATLKDVGSFVASLGQQLDGVEFVKVQLGVTLGGVLSEDIVANLTRGNDGSQSISGEDGLTVAKSNVLERFRAEFVEKFPAAEIVSQNPDLNILLDIFQWRILPPVPAAIFLYGRYRKLRRGIPQTRWPCMTCRSEKAGRYGKRKLDSELMEDKQTCDSAMCNAESLGVATVTEKQQKCETCKGSGLQYADSVQDLLGSMLVRAFQAEDGVFHGMGREDIDVRCLGRGRPFVLELKAPRLRRPAQCAKELQALSAAVSAACEGKVELDGPLRLSSRSEPARLKAAGADKTYTIRFRVEDGIKGPEDEARIFALAGRVLDQRTPSRVEHRRADLVRGRKILELGPIVVEGEEVELTIKAESGTYIKEFVHGDSGRTVPSVTETIGRRCDVIWLDVKEIHAD